MSQREMDTYRELIRENIDYDGFVRDRPYDAGQLDEMVELVVEAVCSKKKNIPASEAGLRAYPLCI